MKIKSLALIAALVATSAPAFADSSFTTTVASGVQETSFASGGSSLRQVTPVAKIGVGYNDGAISYGANMEYGYGNSSNISGQTFSTRYIGMNGDIAYHIALGNSFALSPVLRVARISQTVDSLQVKTNYATIGLDAAWQMSESFGMVAKAAYGRDFSSTATYAGTDLTLGNGSVYSAGLAFNYAVNNQSSLGLDIDYRKMDFSASNSIESKSVMLRYTHSF